MAKNEKTENTFFDLSNYEWSVENVREFDFGTFFTLKLDGLMLYNLRIVPAGKKYPAFIAMPEELGRDNKYYKQYSLYLSKADTAKVIDAVESAIENKPRNKRK